MQVLIPVKDLHSCKSRLAHALPEHARSALMGALLADLLNMLQQCAEVSAITLITRCPQAAALARTHGAAVLALEEDRCLNSGVRAAVDVLSAAGHNEALILHGDLPLADRGDIDTAIRSHREQQADVTLLPDNARQGTNAMLLRVPTAMAFCYGAQSFRRHLQHCHDMQLRVHTLHNERIGCDLDLWRDFAPLLSLRATGQRPQLARWLEQYGELFDWPLAANL